MYSKLVEDFYFNVTCVDGEIKTKVQGIIVTIKPKEVGLLLGFVVNGDTGFNTIDTKKGLDFIGYKRKNLDAKGYKKKDFHQDFEFLADVVCKCILCKDSTYDSSDLQL